MALDLHLAILHTPGIPERVALHNAQMDAIGGPDGLKRVRSFHVYCDYPTDTPNSRNVWNNARRAYGSKQASLARHILLLQDDMRPAVGFFDAVAQIIDTRPNDIIGLFSARRTQRDAIERGDAWFIGTDGLYGGAVLMPSTIAADLVDWCDRHIPRSYRWDDARILLYAYAHHKSVWFTAPSLVQHDGAALSTVGNSNPRRVASVFLPDVSGIDFSRIPDKPLYISGASTYAAEYEKVVIP